MKMSEINCHQKFLLIVPIHARHFRPVREVEHYISQFHISVNDIQLPDIFNAMNYMVHYEPGIFLGNSFPQSLQDAEIQPVAKLLEHVYFRRCSNCLVKPNCVWALDGRLNFDFSLYALQVVLINFH